MLLTAQTVQTSSTIKLKCLQAYWGHKHSELFIYVSSFPGLAITASYMCYYSVLGYEHLLLWTVSQVLITHNYQWHLSWDLHTDSNCGLQVGFQKEVDVVDESLLKKHKGNCQGLTCMKPFIKPQVYFTLEFGKIAGSVTLNHTHWSFWPRFFLQPSTTLSIYCHPLSDNLPEGGGCA